MPDPNQLIRVNDVEALEMIRTLSEQDLRSMGAEVAWLIRQEWARRFSRPNPGITVEQAEKASAGEASSED